MSVFLYLTNQMNSSYGDIEDTPVAEIRLHTFKVLCEWPFCQGAMKIGKIFTTLSLDWISNKKVTYQSTILYAKRRTRKLVPIRAKSQKRFWNGMERWMNFQWKHPPIFQTFRATIWTLLKKNYVEQLTLILRQRHIVTG